MVMLLGQYSTGKTTFIKHLLKTSYPGAHIGPEPTTDRFVVVMVMSNAWFSRTLELFIHYWPISVRFVCKGDLGHVGLAARSYHLLPSGDGGRPPSCSSPPGNPNPLSYQGRINIIWRVNLVGGGAGFGGEEEEERGGGFFPVSKWSIWGSRCRPLPPAAGVVVDQGALASPTTSSSSSSLRLMGQNCCWVWVIIIVLETYLYMHCFCSFCCWVWVMYLCT